MDLVQILGFCGVIGMLYRISRELGSVTQILKDHDRRIELLEDVGP